MISPEAITLIGLAVSVGTFFIGRLTAAKTEGKNSGEVLTELGYIKSGIDDIKRKQEQQSVAHNALARQVDLQASDIQGLKEDFKSLADKNSRDHGRFEETEKEFQKLRAIHEQIHGGQKQ